MLDLSSSPDAVVKKLQRIVLSKAINKTAKRNMIELAGTNETSSVKHPVHDSILGKGTTNDEKYVARGNVIALWVLSKGKGKGVRESGVRGRAGRCAVKIEL